MRWVALLAFLALPAGAFTVDELLKPRELTIDCKDGVCKMSEDDLRFVLEQNQLLGRLSGRLFQRLQDCSGGKST